MVWFCISRFGKSSILVDIPCILNDILCAVIMSSMPPHTVHTTSLMWCWIVCLLPRNLFDWKSWHLCPVFRQTCVFWADVPVPHHSAAAVGGHPPLLQTGEPSPLTLTNFCWFQCVLNVYIHLSVLVCCLFQAIKQMYVLVLGLDVLGNPFGLIRGLSEGVEAFFYEPYQVKLQLF